MRRCVPRALAVALLLVGIGACGGPPLERKPLAQVSIGTNALAAAPSAPATDAPDAAAAIPPSVTDEGPTNPPEPPPAAPAPPDTAAAPPSKVADLCPPKGKKPDLSRLAAKGGCKEKRPQRSALLTDLRGQEQLLAATIANTSDRELALARLAHAYAQLECSVAAACANAREREGAALGDDYSLADARKKTEQHCATLKSEFPKSKRHCP